MGLDLRWCWGSGEGSPVRWSPRPRGWASWVVGISHAGNRTSEVVRPRRPPPIPLLPPAAPIGANTPRSRLRAFPAQTYFGAAILQKGLATQGHRAPPLSENGCVGSLWAGPTRPPVRAGRRGRPRVAHHHLPAPGLALPQPAPGCPQRPPLGLAPPGAPGPSAAAAYPGRLCLGSARPRPGSCRACGRKRLTVRPGICDRSVQISLFPSLRRSDPLSTRCPETPASLGKCVQGPQEPDPIPGAPREQGPPPRPHWAGLSQLTAEAELGLASGFSDRPQPCVLLVPVHPAA